MLNLEERRPDINVCIIGELAFRIILGQKVNIEAQDDMDVEDNVMSQGREVKSIVQIGIVKNKTLYISAVNNSTVSRDDESEDN